MSRRSPVEVGLTQAPDGTTGVLLQLEHGWLVLRRPKDVHLLAAMLLSAAVELEDFLTGPTTTEADRKSVV